MKSSVTCAKIIVQYSDRIDNILGSDRDVGCGKKELSKFGSKIVEFEEGGNRSFECHCSSGLYAFVFHALAHLLDDFERSGSLSYKEMEAFEHLPFF